MLCPELSPKCSRTLSPSSAEFSPNRLWAPSDQSLVEARTAATRSLLPALEAWKVKWAVVPQKTRTHSGFPALGSVTLKSMYPAPARKGPGLPSRTLVSTVGTQERVVEGVNDQA